jgi:dihydroneopterin aldolase
MSGEWTVDPDTGRSNSSAEYRRLCDEVERLIRSEAHSLISGRADVVAGLIMAQLAHRHGLAPASFPSETA